MFGTARICICAFLHNSTFVEFCRYVKFGPDQHQKLKLERLAWKVIQLHHLSQACHVRPLGCGASILFSTLSTSCLQLPARLSGYVTACRALQPHRLQAITAMQPEDVLNELLFFTRQITAPAVSFASSSSSSASNSAARSLMPSNRPLLISAGVTKVAHLQAALQRQHPPPLAQQLQAMLLALPSAWQSVAGSAPAPLLLGCKLSILRPAASSSAGNNRPRQPPPPAATSPSGGCHSSRPNTGHI